MLFVVSSHPLAELIRSLSSRTIKLSNKEREIATEKIDPGLRFVFKYREWLIQVGNNCRGLVVI